MGTRQYTTLANTRNLSKNADKQVNQPYKFSSSAPNQLSQLAQQNQKAADAYLKTQGQIADLRNQYHASKDPAERYRLEQQVNNLSYRLGSQNDVKNLAYNQLKYATPEGISTYGFNPNQAAFIRQGSSALGQFQNDPNQLVAKQIAQENAQRFGAAVPQIQDFYNQQLGNAQSQQVAEQAQRNALQQLLLQNAGQLSGLSQGADANQLRSLLANNSLALSPQQQQEIDQLRQIQEQQATLGLDRNTANAQSQLLARLAATGLSGSSVASRGIADLSAQEMQARENARLAAQAQAIQQQMQLRQLAEQARGTSIQGGLGLLGQQASSLGAAGQLYQGGLGNATDRLGQLAASLQQYSPAAQQAALQQLGQGAANPLQQLAQQQFANQLDVLRLASGQQPTPGKPNALASFAGAVLPSAIGAIGSIFGK